MAIDFKNASLLSCDYKNNYIAEYFVLNRTNSYTIKGFIDNREDNVDASGVAENYKAITEILNAGDDFWEDNIIVNNIDLGKGRVTSISFNRNNPVLNDEYQVSIETYDSGKLLNGPMEDGGAIYSGYQAAFSGHNLHFSKYITDFSDSLSMSYQDGGGYQTSHNLSFGLVSGDIGDIDSEILPTVRDMAANLLRDHNLVYYGWLDEQQEYSAGDRQEYLFDDWYKTFRSWHGGKRLSEDFDNLTGSNYYKNKKHQWEETIDLVNLKFDFSKSFSSLSEDKGYYTSKITHTLASDEVGNVTVTENAEIKGNVDYGDGTHNPFFFAEAAADREVEDYSYMRCSKVFHRAYASPAGGSSSSNYIASDKFNPSDEYGTFQIDKPSMTYTTGISNAYQLFNVPVSLGRQIDSGKGVINYNVSYSNKPNVNKEAQYSHEYSQTISTDTNGITTVTEQGNVNPFNTRSENKYNFDHHLSATNKYGDASKFSRPCLTGFLYYSGISGSCESRAHSLYSDYLAISPDAGRANMGVYKIEGAGYHTFHLDRFHMSSMSIVSPIWDELRGEYSHFGIAEKQLHLMSRSYKFNLFGGVDYTHTYSDDPTIYQPKEAIKNGIKKLDMSWNDTAPVLHSNTYLIPNKGELIHYGNIPQTQLGKRDVKITAIRNRVPWSDHSQIDNLPNNNHQISYLATTAYWKLANMPYEQNKIFVKDAWVSDMSYSFNSDGDMSLNMAMQYTSPRRHFSPYMKDQNTLLGKQDNYVNPDEQIGSTL